MAKLIQIIIKVGLGLLIFLLIGLTSLLAIWYKSDINKSEVLAKYRTMESAFVKVMDSELHIRTVGADSLPTVILLHGSFSSLHTWEGWQKSWKNDFRTIAVDLPGHGLTGPNQSATYHTDYYSDLIWALADSMGLAQIALVGNSMGGKVAWEMALKRPDQVTKLILVDAAGAKKLAKSNTELPTDKHEGFTVFSLLKNKHIAALMTKITPRFLFEKSLKQVYADQGKIEEGLLQRYYELMLMEGNREATVQRFGQSSPNRFEELATLQTPVLILWGKKDSWIPVAQAHFFHDVLPNSSLLIYENAGHVPMEELAEQTAADALYFLKSAAD